MPNPKQLTGKQVDQRLREFEGYQIDNALRGVTDDFQAHLYCLIAHADLGNRERLRQGFPQEVARFEEWREGR